MLGRPGIYFPTPADAGIGFDANQPMAAFVVVVHPEVEAKPAGDGQDAVEGQYMTVDILIFSNVPGQLGGATARTGVSIGTGQGQFSPYNITLE